MCTVCTMCTEHLNFPLPLAPLPSYKEVLQRTGYTGYTGSNSPGIIGVLRAPWGSFVYPGGYTG